MKNRIKAFGRFLLGFSPFWVPAVFLIPYLWTVPKEKMGPILTLSLMLAAVLAAGYSLFLGVIVLWKGTGKDKGLPMGKLFLSNLLDTAKLYGIVLLGGLWVFGCGLVFKELIIEPGKIGEILLMLPLALLVYEGTRFFARKKEIDAAFVAETLQPAKRKWLFLALMQSLAIMVLWLGLIAGGLLIINSFGNFADDHPNTLPAITLMMIVTFAGLPFLRITETWANNKGYIPWLSGYGRWKDLMKD